MKRTDKKILISNNRLLTFGRSLVVILLFIGGSNITLAQTTSYYFEGLTGYSKTDFKFWRPYSRFSADDFAYGVTAGLRNNDNLSLEVSLFDQGDFANTLSGTLRPDLYASTSSLVLQLSVLGSWPINPRWYVYGRAGLSMYDLEAEYIVSDTNRLLKGDDGDVGFVAGLGTFYRFNRRYAIKFEYQRDWYDTALFYSSQEIDKLLIGVRLYY